MGRLGVPVIAEFTTPDPRTVVMQIIDGAGQGSVVQTHVTPLGVGPGRRAAHDSCGGRDRVLGSAPLREGAVPRPSDQTSDGDRGEAAVA